MSECVLCAYVHLCVFASASVVLCPCLCMSVYIMFMYE